MIQVIRWNVHPDKIKEYEAWAKSAFPRLVAVPGLIELRAYGPIAGSAQVVTTYEFKDVTAWAAWSAHETVRQVTEERRTMTLNEVSELWGPSPIVPAPLHPEMYLP
ncbi:MAG: hypothetical protein GX552_17310 [Chloroflexi bacterium]|nr:hypothetical protein [Chloroflexota bacterium]